MTAGAVSKLPIAARAAACTAADEAAARLYEAFLAGRSANTLQAYRQDLEAFARFLAVPAAHGALNQLLRLPHGQANGVLLDYRSAMTAQGLTPATVNRRQSGRPSWSATVSSPSIRADLQASSWKFCANDPTRSVR